MNLLNRTTTRNFILAKADSLRPNAICRVSPDVIDQYEARLRAWIVDDIQHHTGGGTFKESFSCTVAGWKAPERK